MGYSTDFAGRIEITPPLNETEIRYLKMFANTRHMQREQGEYYVDGTFGHDETGVLKNCYNTPPESQPDLWCKFEPTDDGTALVWDESEKTYNGLEWVRYLIDTFLKPGAVADSVEDIQFADFTFDHVCNGELLAQGEDIDDRWKILVANNIVQYIDLE